MNNRTYHRYWIVSVVLIIIAYVFWRVGRRYGGEYGMVCNTLRFLIHAGLITAWLYSVRKRVLHPQIRNYLTVICVLIFFWLGVRYYKWVWCPVGVGHLYLWYLFYLPMIFIPFLAFLSAIMMGRNEEYRFPKWTSLFFVAGFVLLAVVMTNNVHGLIFDLTNDLPDKPGSIYTYGFCYYIILFWCFCCVLGTIVCLCRKFRFLKMRQVLAVMTVFGCVCLYVAGYIGAPWHTFVYSYLSDMTTVYCILTVIIFEMCFMFRLIANNFGYENLFLAGELYMAVENTQEKMVICSEDFPLVSKEMLEESRQHPVFMDDIYRISSYPIQNGRVYWKEDISELLETIRELNDMKLELQGSNELARQELELRQKEAAVIELQKIYDRIELETNAQIVALSQLLEKYDTADTEEQRRTLLYQMVVIGAYLKRRSNMILLSGSAEYISTIELELCFKESLNAMEISDVITCLKMELPDKIPFRSAALLYDFFERAVEIAMPGLRAMMVSAQCLSEGLSMIINTDAPADFSGVLDFPEGEVLVLEDEEEWQLSLFLRGGDLL